MSLLLKPKIRQTTDDTGTGTLSLDHVDNSWEFVDGFFGMGGVFYYTIVNSNGEWETGLGSINGSGVLTRTKVFQSTNSGAAVNFSAGTKEVYCAIPPAALHNAGVIAFANADTTPSVKNGHAFVVSNSGGTTITNFDDGIDGQQITLSFLDSNTTIQHNANVRLSGGSNFGATSNDTISLVFYNNLWYEMSRSVNT